MDTTGNTAQSKINQTEVSPSTWNAYAVCQTVCTSECIILVSVPRTPQAPSHCYCLAYKWKIMGFAFVRYKTTSMIALTFHSTVAFWFVSICDCDIQC